MGGNSPHGRTLTSTLTGKLRDQIMRGAIVDTIADNAAFGAIVIGGRPVRPYDIDVRWVGATLSRNGIIEESGVSAAIMGHPAAGIAWLVNKLNAVGAGLKKGQIVLGGSVTRPVDVAAGDVIHADYGALGAIGVNRVWERPRQSRR